MSDAHTAGNADFWFNKDSFTLNSYMFDFTMDKVTSLSNFFATERGDAAGSSRKGLTINSWSSGTAAGIYYNGAHVTSGGDNNIGTISEGDSLRFAYDSESDKAYLYSLSSKTLLAVTLSKHADYDKELCYFTSGKEGTVQTVGSSASYANGNPGNTNITYGKIYDMSTLAGNDTGFSTYVKTLSIPEPTTATLSLLALAGLAARRRR